MAYPVSDWDGLWAKRICHSQSLPLGVGETSHLRRFWCKCLVSVGAVCGKREKIVDIGWRVD